MADPVVSQLHAWLAEHQDDLIRDLQSMLQIPSLESESLPNAPFGAENRKALDLALKLSDEAGLTTKDIEGYIGYAETGKGERLVISLGHLDVVPTGPGWKHPEFGAEIDEGYIYARGATDDKGPTMASFYAVKALHAICPDLPARVRQVFGCNEESGFGCVKRYMETEEAPTFGVAPDSGWPVCYAEKGIAGFDVVVPLLRGDFELLEFAGGQRPNIVIDHIIAKVKVSPAIRKHVDSKIADKWDENVYTRWEGDVLEIEANGKAAHGSTPFMGDSAATRALRFLLDIAPLTEEEKLKELLMMTHPSGVGLGIHGREDITKDLTSNVGIAKTENGNLILTINIRYPSTWKGEDLLQMVKKYASGLVNDVSIEDFGDSTGLYFAVDSPLVKTIIDVYQEETGDKAEPFTMGGGTYARAVPNTVSIGTGWLGDGNAHETDERVAIESVYKMSRIYAHILYKLATMP